MTDTLQTMWENLPRFADALLVTFQVVGISGVLGFLLALLIAVARCSRRRLVRHGAHAYTIFFRGTPLLAQIFLIYYGSGQFHLLLQRLYLWDFFKEAYFCAILALTLNTAAYVGEILAGGLRAVPVGEVEAARSFGLSRWQSLRKVVLPRALRTTLPALSNEVVLLLKASSLVSTITLVDLMGLTRELVSETLAPFEYFILAGGIYLILVQATTQVFRFLERRWAIA